MKTSISLLLLAAAFSLTACDKTTEKAAGGCMSASQMSGIVGGSRVLSDNPISKQVILLFGEKSNGQGSAICTGTAIRNDVILTAAHCVEGINRDKYYAIFSTDITCESGFRLSEASIPVKDVVKHPKYTGRFIVASDVKYDVALVKLKSPIPSNYKVMKMYDGKSQFSDRVQFAGYGVTGEETYGKESSGFLREISKSYNRSVQVQGEQILVDQSDSRGICTGDSGGPLFVDVNGELQVAGVNSVVSGPKDRICHDMSIMMYVPAYANWIQTAIRSLR
ncbi:Trypsin precursor [compost metagenome]